MSYGANQMIGAKLTGASSPALGLLGPQGNAFQSEEPKREKPEMAIAMDRLQSSINRLEGALSQLGERLAPVRCPRPVAERNNGSVQGPPGGSPLCHGVTEASLRVDYLTELTHNLRNELEV